VWSGRFGKQGHSGLFEEAGDQVGLASHSAEALFDQGDEVADAVDSGVRDAAFNV
jgi:hypothetical protein